MDLILWRHADALDRPEHRGDDFSRPLTDKGLRQAKTMASWLQTRLPAQTKVLSSPALRAVQTVAALTPRAVLVASLAPDAATVDDVLHAAHVGTERDAVLVVGHQPVLGSTAAHLLVGQSHPWHVKKAAVWWLRGEAGRHWDLVAVCDPNNA